MHGSYLNLNQRYNLAPRVAASLKQRQIARHNQSASGAGSGASLAHGSNLYAKGIQQKSEILDTATKFNADARERFVDRANKIQSDVVGENRRVEDLNKRSQAAARNMKSTALTQLSQYAQNKTLMENQAKSDLLNAEAWKHFSSEMDSKDKERIFGMANSVIASQTGVKNDFSKKAPKAKIVKPKAGKSKKQEENKKG
jgi:hypothetical protein